MTRLEFIESNEKWLSENVRANLEQIPDNDWPAVVAGVGVINGGATEPGIDCNVAITHEAISDFESSRDVHWREKGVQSHLVLDGRPAALFENFQRRKGARRETALVIDLGDKRVVLT